MKTRLVCLILALGSAVMATAAEPLKITISGLRSDKGRILWMIQDGTTQQHGMTEPANGNAVIEIGGIRSDSVTLYAYHDENSNYRLDRPPGRGVLLAHDPQGGALTRLQHRPALRLRSGIAGRARRTETQPHPGTKINRYL